MCSTQIHTFLDPISEKYEFVLDRNCVQFEPDHPIFIRTAQAVYDHVDIHGNYQVLHSTRHYGPMVFYLVSENRIDDLIKHYLSNLNLFDACQVKKKCEILHFTVSMDNLNFAALFIGMKLATEIQILLYF